MSKQIAVRLPDILDEAVGSGAQASRVAVVTRAIERERRRLLANRDAEILAATGPDPDLAGLWRFAAGVQVDA